MPIISEIEYGFENTDSKIIAVTGTNGKTLYTLKGVALTIIQILRPSDW